MKLDKIKETFNSFLDNKLGSLNKNHKIAICAAAVLIPAVAFYFFYFSPKHKEINNLQGKKQKLQQELKKVEKAAKKLKKHEAEIAETEIMFKMATNFLPQKSEIPSLLTNISSRGTNAGLDVVSFKPKREIPKEFYAEIPVHIQVNGAYHNVGVFLDEISKLARIVSVSNVKMSSPKKDAGEMILNTQFDLVTYRFLEPSEQDATKGKKKKR